MSLSTCPPFSLSPPPAHSFFIVPTVIVGAGELTRTFFKTLNLKEGEEREDGGLETTPKSYLRTRRTRTRRRRRGEEKDDMMMGGV